MYGPLDNRLIGLQLSRNQGSVSASYKRQD